MDENEIKAKLECFFKIQKCFSSLAKVKKQLVSIYSINILKNIFILRLIGK